MRSGAIWLEASRINLGQALLWGGRPDTALASAARLMLVEAREDLLPSSSLASWNNSRFLRKVSLHGLSPAQIIPWKLNPHGLSPPETSPK